MKVQGRHFETIWLKEDDPSVVQIIDQRYLPFEFITEDIVSLEAMYAAIHDMHLRGAPLIGVAAAFGVYLALLHTPEPDDESIREAAALLKSARPTAVNLAYAVDRVFDEIMQKHDHAGKKKAALASAKQIMEEERSNCYRIGEHGLAIIQEISSRKKGMPVNILTHCNAGWLACVDYGTATAPVYLAHDSGIPVHVIVDETRPRNQGAKLTAWELQQHGVPFTVVVDNAGGHMMQQGMVDLVIVGCDRASPYGDVVNKIGTYLKALAARDNNIPFYAALPSSSIDWKLQKDDMTAIIEERSGQEVKYMSGLVNEIITDVLIMPEDTPVVNFGFDITPAGLVTGLITERGVAQANTKSIANLFPEKHKIPFV